MRKNAILYTAAITLAVLVILFGVYGFMRTEKGAALFEIYDADTEEAVANTNIIIMEKEKVFRTDSEGRCFAQLESRPNIPKQFMGYTIMVISDEYLPMIVYNAAFYPADKPELAMKYRIGLKRPEAFSNVSYTTEFLPASNTEMAEIIEYYKNLIKP